MLSVPVASTTMACDEESRHRCEVACIRDDRDKQVRP